VDTSKSILQKIDDLNGVNLYLKRDDLIDKDISGNKWRKLKEHITLALVKNVDTIETFGGAFANFLPAVAAAGKNKGLKTVGTVRGEEVSNPTLDYCRKLGMELRFASRSEFKELARELREVIVKGKTLVVPEGGASKYGVYGCEDIVNEIIIDFDVITVDAGTGATAAGMLKALKTHQTLVVFPVLKGGWMKGEIVKLYEEAYQETCPGNFEVIEDYHFGGFVKWNTELIQFIRFFKTKYDVQLDPIYTGKQLYGVTDLIGKGYFKDAENIISVHTGGLQGIAGFEKRFGVKCS
jgi:1-aminocyclopropane-1-carboxylate deaminase